MENSDWISRSTYGPDEIIKILPHRFPFLMVDRVLEVKTGSPVKVDMPEAELRAAKPGSFSRTLKNITFAETPFLGHFPEYPIFPGVLTLEAMAQAAAFVAVPFLSAQIGGALPKLAVMLVGFDKVRFRKPVRPGDQLHIQVTAGHVRGGLWTFNGEVTVDSKVVAEGEFLAQVTTKV